MMSLADSMPRSSSSIPILTQQVQLLGEKPKYANARPVITIEEFIPIFVEGSGDEAQTKAPSFPQYFHLSRDTSPLHSRQTSSAPLSSPTVSSQSWFAVSSLLYKQSTNVIKRMGMRGALSPPRTPRSYSSLSLLYSNFVATTHLFRETLLNTTRSPHSSAGPTASAGLTATSIRTRKPSSGRSPEAGDEYKAGEIKDSLNSRREGNTISSAERSWTHAQMSTTVRVPSTLIVSATQRSSETSRGSTQARAVQELFTPKLKSIENATQGGTLRQSSAHETSPTVESTANLMPIAPISTSSELVRSSDNEDERKPAISLHYIHSTSFEHLPGSLSTAPVMHSTETPNTEESTHTTRTPEPEATMSMYTPSDEVKTINSRQEVQTDTTPTSVTSMIILNKITSEVTVSRESKPCDRSEGRDKIAILTQNEGKEDCVDARTVKLWAFGSAYAVAVVAMYMAGFLLNRNYKQERRARLRIGLSPDGEDTPRRTDGYTAVNGADGINHVELHVRWKDILEEWPSISSSANAEIPTETSAF